VSDPATRIRVLIVDDHASFRSGLRALLDTTGDFDVVGEASSGRAATTASARLQPDVILMDVTMPDGDGIEATRRIVEATPHVAIIVLTMDGGDEAVMGALAAGARGYILKGAQRAELFRAIHAVAAGEALFSPTVARRLAGYVSPRDGGRPLPFSGLTEREREVLDLVARGQSNAQITTFLGLSPKTVRNHVSNIFSKLPARDRAEAIVLAREAGMGGEAGRAP
jgi:DNA-binding NarL/FixJ family response regulator